MRAAVVAPLASYPPVPAAAAPFPPVLMLVLMLVLILVLMLVPRRPAVTTPMVYMDLPAVRRLGRMGRGRDGAGCGVPHPAFPPKEGRAGLACRSDDPVGRILRGGGADDADADDDGAVTTEEAYSYPRMSARALPPPPPPPPIPPLWT